jgi:flagellar assembly factor FliW
MAKIYQTLRFGPLQIKDEDILSLPEGMLGFPDCKQYVLLEDPAQAPFQWLQSLDNVDLSFVLVDPLVIKPDYRIQVSEHEVETLELDSAEEARIFVVVSVPENLTQATANLKGPVVINPNKNIGKQLVLMDEQYSTKYLFLQSLPQEDDNKNDNKNDNKDEKA